MTRSTIESSDSLCSRSFSQKLSVQTLKNLCESRLMKITSLVIAFLTLIVGGALIALAGGGVLSFPLGLILGSVLVLFSSIYLVSCCKFFTLKEMTMTCSVKSKINIWFEKQRNKDIEKALENPDLFGENKRNVGNRSARNQLEMILHETDGIILKRYMKGAKMYFYL